MSSGIPEEEKPVPAEENKADAPNGDEESRKIKVYTEGSKDNNF